MGLLDKILGEFVRVIEEWRDRGLIKGEDLGNPQKTNLHSYLQYAMIRAGEIADLFPLLECKIRYAIVLDPREYGLLKKSRKRHSKKVDIAFFKEKS
ncbi:MAG: hypothetical protein DRO00_08655 [Thermoproteota archaeon]|nr:MAG: hypothetical protein DRO00_08655 [Candidatus Korarchaeota archaeon]